MNKTQNTIRTICEIGIFAAIGYVLDELQGIISKPLFINGGSIGFAMIAVLIIAYRRGWLPAILTGLIMGGLDIATSAYILHPAQLLLDYILPYAIVGLVGVLKPFYDRSETKNKKIFWLISGTIIGGLLKLLSHYFAGVIFWADPNNFAWGLTNMNVYLYCFLYNFAFIGPSIVLTGALLIAIYLRAPRILTVNNQVVKAKNIFEDDEKEKNKPQVDYFKWVLTSIIIAGAIFTFTFYLIKYIKSFSDYTDSGAYGYDFDPDSMVIFVMSFMLIVLGINSIFAIIKNVHSEKLFFGVLLTILSCSLTYCIARLIRMYVKDKDPTTYWFWFGVGIGTILITIVLFIIRLNRQKKMGD